MRISNTVNLDLIQVACTACLRPKILEITLSSFNDGLLKQFRRKELIINIDPVGDNGAQVSDILAICYKYFDAVKYNTPEKGDFSKAVKWVWQQIDADFFLHLEDDWMLNKHISKNYLLATLFADERTASVRLNRHTSIKDKNLDGVSLNPSLFKTKFIQEALNLYNDELDPEKQFFLDPLIHHSKNHIHLAYGDKKNWYIEGAYVTDIGKYWRKSHGIEKIFNRGKFAWYADSSKSQFHIKSWIFFKTLWLRKLLNKLR